MNTSNTSTIDTVLATLGIAEASLSDPATLQVVADYCEAHDVKVAAPFGWALIDIADKLATGEYEARPHNPCAPSHGKARQYVRNKNVWIVLVPKGAPPVTTLKNKHILDSWLVAREVDSRYSGPRSAYGRANKRQDELLALLRSPRVQLAAVLLERQRARQQAA